MKKRSVIERIGYLEEEYCSSCDAKKVLLSKGHSEKEAMQFCTERCEVGKQIRGLGRRLAGQEVEKDFYLVNHLDVLGRKSVAQVAKRLRMTQKDVLDKYNALKKTHHRAG